MPDNPYWTGNGADNRSRVWASGVRNPFRFSVKPGPRGPGPGTLYIGDVGWFLYEELNVCTGGENFGWPCVEGNEAAPAYPTLNPAHSGCDTIQTPANPGPLTGPLATWHHSNPAASSPPGFTGATAVGGVFYEGQCYPEAYRGGYFFADFSSGWIRVLKVDGQNNFVALHTDQVHRITFDNAVLGDLDGDCVVGIQDFLALLAAWGRCSSPPAGCPADLDGDGFVGILDLLALLANWS